ncbi:aromatic ring-hydroxylating dioxygenase subunit alpha [Roseovarius faecimaris]|uniref:Aromatic ring-hydroxylating dioxygenase subunit alpha n=1 Tax=Roseovarius faecimaris TaxID=2494550 RepID=A0A6I6IJ31_9RHOB|nr:aromatic ring-hydroxylating dioxygenase subunit alpha [Roseovarius faecimaris]QGX96819.1 aromatic ring-hydroxylating dioxygenase subunit alpha [Roseovarius faecimaris]
MAEGSVLETNFNGLASAQPSLPAEWYYDPAHYARELSQIWGRNWVYLCRAESLEGPQSFRTFDVAGQPVLLLRDGEGRLKGFFNTCRHRGSILCTQAEGTLAKPLITCPYHQWVYDLTGRLRATGPMRPVAGFDRADHPLLEVSVAEWGGFVFVNLDRDAPGFESLYGAETAYVAHWPLEEMRVGHRYSKRLKCNWKIFWENFNECLHCPNIHPELSALVPIYGRAIMARRDDPDWQAHAEDDAPHLSGGLRDGAETWSMDGTAQGRLPGLTDEDVASGQRYVTVTPSVFVAHHADYVRSVQITPVSPEEMDLTSEWLFHPDTLAQPDFDMARITDFATLVLDQDGAASELNQAGLRAGAFTRGVLMQEEYEVFLFQDWIRQQLGEPMLGSGAASRASRRAAQKKED